MNNNQRDPKWANKLLGGGPTTIGISGCTISVLGDILGLTPDVVNDKLDALPKDAAGNTGFALNDLRQRVLLYWSRISEAFPGITVNRVWAYDNDAVLQALTAGNKVMVEVPAGPIGGSGSHWVEYIGNQQLKDPWTGTVRPTSDFPNPTGFAVISGTYTQTVTPPPTETPPPPVQTASVVDATELNTHGLDITNSASLQVALDTWYNVSQGLYEPISNYNALKTSYEALQQERDQTQIDYQNTLKELTKVKGANVDLEKSDYDYAQKALEASTLADSYEKDLAEIYGKLALDEKVEDPALLLQMALQKIDSLEKAQTVTPGEAEKQLTLWEGFFLKIAQSALNHGLNDWLKTKGLAIIDLTNNTEDPTIGDKIVEFLEVKFKDASLVTQVQAQMQSLKENVAKTQPFLVKLGYAVKNLIFVK